MRKAIASVALVAVLMLGGFMLIRQDDDGQWTVVGRADDATALAEACGLNWSLSSGPLAPGDTNVSITVDSKGAASQAEDCMRDNGATLIETSPASELKSFENTGP